MQQPRKNFEKRAATPLEKILVFILRHSYNSLLCSGVFFKQCLSSIKTSLLKEKYLDQRNFIPITSNKYKETSTDTRPYAGYSYTFFERMLPTLGAEF